MDSRTGACGGTQRIRLTVPSDLRYGEATRAMLDALSRRLEHETETVGLSIQVTSSFTEAFNNIVRHAYGGSRSEKIEVEVVVSPSCIRITLADRGEGMAIAPAGEGESTTVPIGGLGTWIICSVMSRVEYARAHEMNVLTLTKDFNKPLQLSDERQTVA